MMKEGWQQQGDAKVLVCCHSSPLWALAAPALQLKLSHVVCLTSQPVHQAFGAYLAATNIELVTSTQLSTRLWKRILRGIQIVLVDGDVGSWLDRIWDSASVRTVVCTGFVPGAPAGWVLDVRRLKHEETGGVTNAELRVGFYERLNCPVLSFKEHPRQDLRSVMKMGVWGRKVSEKSFSCPPGSTGRVVHPISDKVIGSWGLMPNSACRTRFWPRVRTRYGGSVWVDRFLSPAEKTYGY